MTKISFQRPYQQPKLFPNDTEENLIICVSGVGANKEFTSLISDRIPSLDYLEKCQCFPLFFFEERKKTKPIIIR